MKKALLLSMILFAIVCKGQDMEILNYLNEMPKTLRPEELKLIDFPIDFETCEDLDLERKGDPLVFSEGNRIAGHTFTYAKLKHESKTILLEIIAMNQICHPLTDEGRSTTFEESDVYVRVLEKKGTKWMDASGDYFSDDFMAFDSKTKCMKYSFEYPTLELFDESNNIKIHLTWTGSKFVIKEGKIPIKFGLLSDGDEVLFGVYPKYEVKELVEDFVTALGDRDYRLAYSKTKVMAWGTYKQFSSTKAFGGINKTTVTKIENKGKTNGQWVVYVEAKYYDPVNGNLDLKENFKVKNTERGFKIVGLKIIQLKKF